MSISIFARKLGPTRDLRELPHDLRNYSQIVIRSDSKGANADGEFLKAAEALLQQFGEVVFEAPPVPPGAPFSGRRIRNVRTLRAMVRKDPWCSVSTD